ncbi:MAG: glycosyltransferase [Actinomycetota bacterium]
MIDPKTVSIIIPHLGGTTESEYALDQCLTSLEETVPDIKKIIAKNGSPIEGQSCSHLGDIILKEQGQCKAVNAAVATVSTPWILVTNDDMVYSEGWWEKLIDEIPPSVMCLSPKLIEPRPGAPTFEVYFCGGAGGDFDKAKWLEFARNYKGVGYNTGFNLPFLIKRELWNLIGGYDINYGKWGSNSDSDLEYKIRLAGVQPYQNTNCIVYHFSQTSGTFEPKNDSYRFRNYAYFKEKWGFDRTDNGIWEANFAIPDPPVRKFVPEWEGKYGKVNH